MARPRTRSKVTYYDRVEFDIAHGPGMRDLMKDIVDDIIRDARPGAPVSNGPGHARGSHARDLMAGEVLETPRGWEGRAGWPRAAYYLLMHEKGWVHKAARPFLRPAVERRRDV